MIFPSEKSIVGEQQKNTEVDQVSLDDDKEKNPKAKKGSTSSRNKTNTKQAAGK